MFKSFFFARRWWAWSLLGSVVILLATAYRVQLDVQINDWFGSFYDLIQEALGKPGSITAEQFWGPFDLCTHRHDLCDDGSAGGFFQQTLHLPLAPGNE